MAIPANLYKVELGGRWEHDPGAGPIVYYRWAMTWWVQADIVSDAKGVLQGIAAAFAQWFVGPIVGQGFVAPGTVVDKRRGIRVASSAVGDIPGELRPTNSWGFRSVPAQVSMIVLGRTVSLGEQTRKWIPCVADAGLLQLTPEWDLNAFAGSFKQWATDALTVKVNGPVTITPVVWNPGLELVMPITEILVNPIPRTIRRRSLSEPFPYQQTWP